MPAVLTSRITLNVEPSLKAKARKVAQSRGISVSTLFSNFVSTLSKFDEEPPLDLSNAPITARALRLSGKKIELPKDWDYREELRERLYKKYEKYLK